MSKIEKKVTDKSKLFEDIVEKPSPTVGRKRDQMKDTKILDATIDILAEVGFDGMTMDMVAARAKAGKATVYRRWSSKTDLVQDALTWMNRNHLELDLLPDTGTLRGDLLAVLKPQSIEEENRKLRVISGLGSLFLQNPEFIEKRKVDNLDSWVAVNRKLMHRAVDCGELPADADIEMACRVISSMAYFRGHIERKPIDKQFFTELIDGILLPALKNPKTTTKNLDR